MLDQRTIFEIHRLAHEGLSTRKSARAMGIARRTAHKYLDGLCRKFWRVGTVR